MFLVLVIVFVFIGNTFSERARVNGGLQCAAALCGLVAMSCWVAVQSKLEAQSVNPGCENRLYIPP